MSERKWVYHYDDTDEWVSSSDPNDHAMYLLQDITVQLNRREDRVAALEAAQQSWEEERARLIAERDAWAERYTARSQDLEAERDALRHEWQAVIAALDGTSPKLGDPETVFRVDALRLQVEALRTWPAAAVTLSDFDKAHIQQILVDPKEYTNFSAHLLRLIAKADDEQKEVLSSVYPDHVAAFREWERGPTTYPA